MRRTPPLQAPQNVADIPLAIWEEEAARRNAAAGTRALPERVALRDFLAAAWPVLEGPRRPFLPNWHIDAKCEFLQAVSDGQIPKLIINEPPSFAKSITSSVCWPAWDWGPNRRPDRRFLCTSYGGDAASPAMRDADRMRKLLVSPFYQASWGTLVSLGTEGDPNARNIFHNSHGGYRISAGMDGAVPGNRADIMLIDDPTKPPGTAETVSLAELAHAADVWEGTLRSRAWDDGAAVVLVMHRLHQEDLTGYFLKQDGWVHLKLPALFEPASRCRVFVDGELFFEDPRTEAGEALQPSRRVATAETRDRAKLQPWLHMSQDQQDPQPMESGQVGRIDRWNSLPDHFELELVVADMAFKDRKQNSYVVFQHWAKPIGAAEAWLLRNVRAHLDFAKTLDAFAAFCEGAPRAAGKYVEDKANGPGIVSMLKDRVPGLMTTSEDALGPSCLKEFCKGSKEGKFAAVTPYFAAGNVKIPSAAALAQRNEEDWTPTYVLEIRAFPNVTYNDQVDATAMAVWKLLGALAVRFTPVQAMEDMAEGVGKGTMADFFRDMGGPDTGPLGLPR